MLNFIEIFIFFSFWISDISHGQPLLIFSLKCVCTTWSFNWEYKGNLLPPLLGEVRVMSCNIKKFVILYVMCCIWIFIFTNKLYLPDCTPMQIVKHVWRKIFHYFHKISFVRKYFLKTKKCEIWSFSISILTKNISIIERFFILHDMIPD